MTIFIRSLFLIFTFLAIHFGDIFGILLAVSGFIVMEKFCEDLEKFNGKD